MHDAPPWYASRCQLRISCNTKDGKEHMRVQSSAWADMRMAFTGVKGLADGAPTWLVQSSAFFFLSLHASLKSLSALTYKHSWKWKGLQGAMRISKATHLSNPFFPHCSAIFSSAVRPHRPLFLPVQHNKELISPMFGTQTCLGVALSPHLVDRLPLAP